MPSGVGTLSESYTAPVTDVFIEGVCHEKSFLRENHLSIKKGGIWFVCMRRITSSVDISISNDKSRGGSESDEDTTNATADTPSPLTPVLKLASISLLDTQCAVSVGMTAAVRFLRLLCGIVRDKSESSMSTKIVVFCGDSIDATLQFAASKHSIVIVSLYYVTFEVRI